MRFASAAYGVAMIKNAKLLQTYNADVQLYERDKAEKAEQIRKYLNIHPRDLKKVSPSGGDMKVLNHFIAVSSKRGALKAAVVLAIRGTYTISGLKVDAEAYSREFCGGVAHEGMANAAEALWEAAGGDVRAALLEARRQWGDVEFVITGHSLGAGTAALLALKLRYEDAFAASELEGTNVVCYAFAPPPVYLAGDGTSPRVERAVSETHAFIHENDCVPFASVAAVRHLSETMADVGGGTSGGGLPFLNAAGLMAAGLVDVPLQLVNEINSGDDRLAAKEGAEKLAIPAPHVVWMRRTHSDDKGRPMYNATLCRTKSEGGKRGVNDLNVLLHPQMIADHMNPQYERAIYSVKEQLLHPETVLTLP